MASEELQKQLSGSGEPFNIPAFQKSLKTAQLGRSFLYRTITSSTNDIAQREAEDNAPHGTVVFAEEQTRGVGRVEGRVWESNARKNILFSCVLWFESKTEMTKVTIATPAAVARACREVLGVNAWVKWPNDVWVGARKVSGFMADTGEVDGHFYCVLGVGVNVNEDFTSFSEVVQGSAQSLAGVLGEGVSVCREHLLASILNELERLLKLRKAEIVVDHYCKYDLLCGKTVKVTERLKGEEGKKIAHEYNATALRIRDDGFLVVKCDDEEEERLLMADDVSVRMVDFEDLPAMLVQNDVQSVLTGTWQNGLGSIVKMKALNHGALVGEYRTSVGNAIVNEVHGSWTALKGGELGGLVSWTVAWTDVFPGRQYSTTAWSGRLWINPSEKPKITTTWLLTSTTTEQSAWESVLTNQDQFLKLDE